MNDTLNRTTHRPAGLPTVLLTLALMAGFASVGQAQDIPQTTVTAQAPLACDSDGSIRSEMQARAERAVRGTQINVASRLNRRLFRQHQQSFRVAGGDLRQRG